MDTNPLSERSFCSIEISGPHGEHDEMERVLGDRHPYNHVEDETLFYYDQPIISICHVAGDPRPRLDILVDQSVQGEDPERVFTTVRHNLVFDTIETLRASLYLDQAPTLRSYQLAERIIRYRSVSTQIGHPRPRHHMITASLAIEEIPAKEMPHPGHEPQGLPVPGLHRKEAKS